MISLFLVIIAAICNAIMDTLSDRAHFGRSIFKHKNLNWWLKEASWHQKHINKELGKWWIPEQFSDAWHTFKTIMLFSLIFAIVSFRIPHQFNCTYYWLNYFAWCLILGICWNVTFSLFYETLLKSKK